MNPTIELRDIHLPDPVSLWPPAPGWWLLIVLVGLLVVGGVIAMRRRRHRTRVRRVALAALAGISNDRPADDALLAAEISRLLRRACLAVFPREQVAGLTGDRWVGFLDDLVRRADATGNGVFGPDAARALALGPFVNDAGIERDALLHAARKVIEALPDAPERNP